VVENDIVLSNDSRDRFWDCEKSMATVVDDVTANLLEKIVMVVVESIGAEVVGC
jgi:hypothetical protein